MMWIINSVSLRLRRALQRLQSILAFESWAMYPQFNNKQGLGRTALLACCLGMVVGMHLVLLIVLLVLQQQQRQQQLLDQLQNRAILWMNTHRQYLAIQWCTYAMFVGIFHLAEFFATAIYNPHVVSSDSFVVNHSHAYTAAALLSGIEFSLRFIFFPQLNSTTLSVIGLLVVIMAQMVRTTAIITCGESFNHLIQTSKKENHVLVTRGIYKYLRHPSYFGFFYWAVGSQVLLCNPVQIIFFSCAVWMFFQRRIPYEEESLQHHFPDSYPAYAKSTWIGIPFLRGYYR